MTFHWPHLLWLLFLPVLLAGLELRRRHAERNQLHPKIIRAEAGPQNLTLDPDAKPGDHEPRIRWRLWLSLALTIAALARPQWGKLDEPVFDQSREIIIALDLSRSMLSDDVRPSRLERAKLLVTSLLEELRGERVGLVVFSGTAFLQSPLSADYEILRDFLPGLNTSYLPEGGTNYAALLNTSLNAFSAAGGSDRYLIILSDGEATDDDWKPNVADLKNKGIRVIGLGVGTAAGSMIPDGTGAFVKDERGAVVLSKLESSTLQELAAATNGVYTDASSWVDIAQLIEKTVATGQKGKFVERSRTRLAERFQWALMPALFFVFWSFYREFPVRPRVRDIRYSPTVPQPETKPNMTAGVASLLVLLAVPAFALFVADRASAACMAAEKESSSGDSLTKLVASLSQHPSLTAQQCADFVHATLLYGKDLQAAQKHVPPAPIDDGLAAVDEGEKLDPKAANWTDLRKELEALLKKKDPPPQQPPQQSPQDKKDNQQKKDQQQQQQQNSQQQNSQAQKQNQPQDQKQSQPQNDSAPKPPEKPANSGEKEEAEKSDKPPQPSDPSDEQKVGGSQDKKSGEANKDPALALPLQKLDQLKDQDSPAKLFQLMQGQDPKPKKSGKDW